MTIEKSSQAFEAFSKSVKNNNVLDDKTTRLIYLAASMAIGCYPWMIHCLSDAKENGISDDEINAAKAVVMAVSAGRVNAQFKDATGQ